MRVSKSSKRIGPENDRSQRKIHFYFKAKDDIFGENARSASPSEDDSDVIPPTPLHPLPSNICPPPPSRLKGLSSPFPACVSSPSQLSPSRCSSPSFRTTAIVAPSLSSPDVISPTQKPTDALASPGFVPPTPEERIRIVNRRKQVSVASLIGSDAGSSTSDGRTHQNFDGRFRPLSSRLQVKRKLLEAGEFQLAKHIRPLARKSDSDTSCREESLLRPSFAPPGPPPSPLPVVFVADEEDVDLIKADGDNRLKSNNVGFARDSTEKEDWNLSNFDNSPMKTSPVKFSDKGGRSSVLCRRFGRHDVVGVRRSRTDGRLEVILDLRCAGDSKRERQCILRGYWTDSIVRKGDVVNVLASFDEDDRAVVDDDGGILVVNPDLLLSGTTVVSTLFCERRAVFGEWFRGIDRGNKRMLVGSLVHQLFQDSVLLHFKTETAIQRHLTVVLNRSENILERHKLRADCSDEWLARELAPFVKQIHTFIGRHLEAADVDRSMRPGVVGRAADSSSDVTITRIRDIEENIWSPRFGLKGKLDLTVEVKIHDLKSSSKKVVPLEVKTGRATFSAEHSGQVVLYSMMCGDRRADPEGGILLYIRDGRTKEITADHRSRHGLIQRRNELTRYLENPIERLQVTDGEEGKVEGVTASDRVRYKLAPLATPLSESRLCSLCPYLTTCAVHHKTSRTALLESDSDHPFNELASRSTAHLAESDLEYFSHWCTCLFLEKAALLKGPSQSKNIWLMTADERETRGECFADMVLVPLDRETQPGGVKVDHRFARRPESQMESRRLSDVGISVYQQVVVSIEHQNSIATAIGSILAVSESFVDIRLDRNLYSVVEYRDAVYRIDAHWTSNVITTCFTNVARLMADCEASAAIRKIVIECRQASIRPKIGKNVVVKAKAIFSSLNKEQRCAVLKCLMTDDYVLIKGMPGAGKTATIVALIAVLSEMGLSVLLTSHTHSAVDNVLVKLEERGLDFLRLGLASRIDPKLLRYSAERQIDGIRSPEDLSELFFSKRIVAATCLGCNHSLLSGGRRFDYCIIDEASQVLQPACLAPLFLSHKFVLVGDHHQLPPIVRSDEAKNIGMEESLFYRLDSPVSTVELSHQYRMNSEINRLANCLTYKEALKCATEEVSNSVLQLRDVSAENIDDPWLKDVLSSDLQKSVLLLDTCEMSAEESRDANGHLYNRAEVDIVMTVVATLAKFGLSGKDIGVISPYRNQVTHIVSALKVRQLPLVDVNTVDQYQGRDKDVIVICFVKSHTCSNPTLPAEILNDKRRINVAITRARKKLILIGNSKTLMRYTPIETLFNSLKAPQRIVLHRSTCFGS